MRRKPRVLVTGATGQISSAVLRRLAADRSLEVIAGIRSTAGVITSGVQTVHLDYDDTRTLRPALEGIDRVFMATGCTIKMLRQSRDLLNAARLADVEHIVHLGAPGGDDTPVEHWLWHQFVERYIEWSGFSFTHLRPEIFMQNLLGHGGVRTVLQGVIRHYVAAAQLSWVDGDDVAAVAAVVLANPEEHAEVTYRIGSEVKSFGEIAEVLTRALGQPFRYEPRPASEFLEAAIDAGAEPSYMRSAYETYAACTAGKNPGEGKVFDSFAQVTGRQPVLWDTFARNHHEHFVYGTVPDTKGEHHE